MPFYHTIWAVALLQGNNISIITKKYQFPSKETGKASAISAELCSPGLLTAMGLILHFGWGMPPLFSQASHLVFMFWKRDCKVGMYTLCAVSQALNHAIAHCALLRYESMTGLFLRHLLCHLSPMTRKTHTVVSDFLVNFKWSE